MPKVSFIVAVYNSMPYLTQCLDSLLAQTVKDIEVICVNDCSPDNSAEVISDYIKKDSRVKLINHTTNKRQGGAWNTGVQAASGEYLCFVDADDWLELDYAEVLTNTGNEDEIIVARHFFNGSKLVNNIEAGWYSKCNGDIKLYMLLYGFFFITNFYKKSLFNNFSFVENNMYHDFMTHLLFFKTDNIEFTNKAGYHYRTDNISTQRSVNNKSFWGRLDVAKLEYESYKQIEKAASYKHAIEYHFYELFYMNTLIRAFWGYTKLNWDYINIVRNETQVIVPSIKKNIYYQKRFERLSKVMRLPIYFFEVLPDWLVTGLHKTYWVIRNIIKK